MNRNIYCNYSVQQLDEQYNNRARVPEHQEYFDRWKLDSERARRQCKARTDIAYGTSERETLDVFPAHQPGSPGVIFIHGGYWQALDKSYFSFLAPPLLEQGYTVVILNYPLCPTARLRDIVTSVRWAMIYLFRNLKRYNGDPERLYLIGHSAGGHLAAMLLATAWSELDNALQAGMIKNGISVSGVFELEPLRHTFVNQALQLDQSEIDELSPINLAPPAVGNLDLFVGANESDEFKRQSMQLARAWPSGTFTTRYQALDGHDHFSIVDEIINPQGTVLTCLRD